MLGAGQQLLHLVQRGPGISPFAAFAEALTPLPEHAAGGTLLSRLALSGCALRIPSGPALGSPRIDAPLSVPPVSAAAAAASGSGASASQRRRAGSSTLRPGVSPRPATTDDAVLPENMGENRERGLNGVETDCAARRASTGSATGPTAGADNASEVCELTACGEEGAQPTGVPAADAKLSTADAKRKSAGARRGLQLPGSKLWLNSSGGGSSSASRVQQMESSTPSQLQRIADVLDGGGIDALVWDQMIEGVEGAVTPFPGPSDESFADLSSQLPQRAAESKRGQAGADDASYAMLFGDAGLPIDPPAVKPSKSRGGRPKRCNCKNSKCLKLYCDCFSVGLMCDGCNCNDCKNTPSSLDAIEHAKQQVLKRNPKAFSAKFVGPTEVCWHAQHHGKP